MQFDPSTAPKVQFTADNTYYVQSGMAPTSYTELIARLDDADKPTLTQLVTDFLSGTDDHDAIEQFLIEKGLIQDLSKQ